MKIKKYLKEISCFQLLLASFVLFAPFDIFAFTTPVEKSLGYELYDIGVNKMLKGPIGFLGGIAIVVFSAAEAKKHWMAGLFGILIGTAIIKADSICTTMGMMI